MTIFASIFLGALWSIAAGLIGHSVGTDNEITGGVGVVMFAILLVVTLFFVLICAQPNA